MTRPIRLEHVETRRRGGRPPAQHGSHQRYRKGCRCEPCKAGHAVYNRKKNKDDWERRKSKRGKGSHTQWRCECGRLEDRKHRCGIVQPWEDSETADQAFYRELSTKPRASR